MNLKFIDKETFVSSDWHLNHGHSVGENPRGIIKHQKRPFASSQSMDEFILAAINAKVPKKATLIFVGDWCWFDRVRDKKIAYENVALRYRDRINCDNIFFVWGNHDKRLRSSQRFRNAFVGCYDLLEAEIGGQAVVFSHYCYKVWNGSRYGAWNVYGHSHGALWEGLTEQELLVIKEMRKTVDEKNLALFDKMTNVCKPAAQTDCGIDTRTDFAPYSWAELSAKIRAKKLDGCPDVRIGAHGSEEKLKRYIR